MRDYISIKNLKRLGNKKNIYVLDENFLLKIYEKSNKNNSDERILRCYYNYKFLYKSGFPTPNIYKIVDTEYGIGFVMDYLPGKTISNMIKLKPYKMIKYLRKYGDIVKKMHNMELNKNEFVDVKKHLIDLYGVVRGKYLNLFLEDEFRKILEIIEKVPNRNTLIHGDCNDGNFLVDGAESYIIDLDTVAIGHPIFDLAEIRAKKKFFEYDKIILNRNYTENRIKKRKLYELQKERLLCEVFWFFFIEGYTKQSYFSKNNKKLNRIIDIYSNLFIVNIIKHEEFYGNDLIIKIINESKKNLLDFYNNGVENIWSDIDI